jgi:hypothetical protein
MPCSRPNKFEFKLIHVIRSLSKKIGKVKLFWPIKSNTLFFIFSSTVADFSSVADPDGSRRAKMTVKSRKNLRNKFLVIKTMDPDWIRISIQPKMLDPDLYQMNTDPEPWTFLFEQTQST